MQAFVLKKIPYGESDLVVRFLLETGEVVSTFAIGASKSKRRYPHHFDLTGLYQMEWHRTENSNRLLRLQTCDLLNYQPSLSASMESLCRWSMVLEWIALDEGHLFDFEEVSKIRASVHETLIPYFQFFIGQMKIHGFYPELDLCLHCQLSADQNYRFNFQEGGLVHSECGNGSEISESSVRFLREHLMNKSVEDLSNIQIRDLDGILIPFLEWQLGRVLKSKKVFLEAFPQKPLPNEGQFVSSEIQ